MKLPNNLIKKVIRKIRFYQRFSFSESVKSASNFDADKTELLRKNADKNRFDLQ
jgi:hypothetical protein